MSIDHTLTFHDGHTIPQLGLGVWQTPADTTAQVVETALAAGYRHIDTAAIYGNEAGVGQGLKAAGLPRDQVFVTTKVWNVDQGFDATLRAFDLSLQKLQLDRLDLYLIHWPSPARDLYVETWRALVRLRDEGRVRSIGVSNFEPAHLDRLIQETGVVPVLNQVELHPQFQQRALSDYLAGQRIAVQAWSPLGQGKLLSSPAIEALAKKHGRTPAQVIIRWHLQRGHIVIPKSVTPSRIVENADVFGFELDAADLHAIAALDRDDGRIGPHPAKADF